MLDTFITSFRLKNTYRTNTIIYSSRCLPIIGKDVYKRQVLYMMVSPVSVQSQTDMGRLKKKPSSLIFINLSLIHICTTV